MFKIEINESEDTFTDTEVKDDHENDWDFLTTVKPGDLLYLVRVRGQTGDSEGSSDTSWDVEVFHDLKDAESLADRIDFSYDLYRALDSNWPKQLVRTYLRNASEERLDNICGIIEIVGEADQMKRQKYIDKNVRSISYEYEGKPTSTAAYWIGHFESLYYVEVIVVPRSGTKRRWRDHRLG